MNLYPFVRRFNDQLRAINLEVSVVAPDADTAWSMVLKQHGGPESHWLCFEDKVKPVLALNAYLFQRKRPSIVALVILAVNEEAAWESLPTTYLGGREAWDVSEHPLLPGLIMATARE